MFWSNVCPCVRVTIMAVDWKLCVEWLVRCRILPPDSKLAMGNGTLMDLALFLKDGVALCQLLNRLKPHAVDNKAFSHRPQTSQVPLYS